MDECTCFREYDRPVNPRRWVSNGLNAYNVVVDELGMSGEVECDDVCGCRMLCELKSWLAFVTEGDVECWKPLK